MADINIERKQGPNVIPWIIGLLVLALVAWFFLANRGDDRTVRDGTVVDTVTATDAGMTAPPPAGTTGGAWVDPATGTADTSMMGTGMTDTAGVGSPP